MSISTINATATPATGLIKAVEILWGAGCPNAREDRRPDGQWFQFSVRATDTPWYNLASCATYAELVAYMTKVAEMRVLPEGTLISAGRCHGYCQYDGSYREQTFLLSQVGRALRLEVRD